MMRSVMRARGRAIVAALTVAMMGATAQEPAGDSLSAIDAEFRREAIKLEKARLDRIAKLAATKAGAEADRAYEAYFRGVISAGLYADAEPTAKAVMASKAAAPQVLMLAHLVGLVAQADRGAHEESLASLKAAIAAKAADSKPSLPAPMKLLLVDAYLQRLVRGGRFDIARRALKAIGENAEDDAVKDLVARRSRSIDLVGKPAPAISATDIDGKPYKLADAKGDVVLVVFWASWCLPNAQEVDALDDAYDKYRAKGFRIVGVDVDALQEDGRTAESVAPDVKRFLIERNVRWPNLIDTPGEASIAAAFGVTDIPANVLIGRDGTVVHLDLAGANLDEAIAGALAK